VTGKLFGRKRSRASFKVLSWHLPGGTEETHEKPVRIICVLAGIRTRHFSDTCLERDRYANPFDGLLLVELWCKLAVDRIFTFLTQYSYTVYPSAKQRDNSTKAVTLYNLYLYNCISTISNGVTNGSFILNDNQSLLTPKCIGLHIYKYNFN
jgi:hypothetical protein